jgi:hypothetical protein
MLRLGKIRFFALLMADGWMLKQVLLPHVCEEAGRRRKKGGWMDGRP